jgi:GTP cyclohydrolase II
MSDPSKELALRVHDECNGSDVFGSDICTCKPYLIFAIEECIRTAQRGGVGVVVYFRKEGRALGEVTKSVHFHLIMSLLNLTISFQVPRLQPPETWR